jgi:GGDEF domain-containing protein
MPEQPLFDPRLLSQEVVGFVVPTDSGLPCGQEVCTPLQGDCRETGIDHGQAVISCARYMAASALHEQNRELAETLTSHEQLIRQLSVDQKTGILTLNANDALFDRLRETHLLEQLRAEGYVMQFTFGDLDKLKEHNTLGDHAGGDGAIAVGAHALRELYRRGYDVVGVLEHEQEVREAFQESAAFSAVSRFAAGDELVVMSFVPPNEQNRDRLATASDLEHEVARITDAFTGLYAEYWPKRGINIPEMHTRLAAEGFVFGLTSEGKVRAPVTMTFATVMAPVPVSQAEFEEIKLSADSSMMVAKRQRKTITTRGTFSYLLSPDDK